MSLLLDKCEAFSPSVIWDVAVSYLHLYARTPPRSPSTEATDQELHGLNISCSLGSLLSLYLAVSSWPHGLYVSPQAKTFTSYSVGAAGTRCAPRRAHSECDTSRGFQHNRLVFGESTRYRSTPRPLYRVLFTEATHSVNSI